MSIQESLARKAFYTARSLGIAELKRPREDGSVYLNRFAELELVHFATGTGVSDTRPVSRALPWSSFCDGVTAYASVVIGPTEEDKRSKSKYIVAGEVVRSVAVASDGLDGGLGGPTLESYRSDIDVRSVTMLVLDCDAPVASAPLARALTELSLAYCIAPTWASSVEAPRWRCFIPVAPLAVDSGVRGREQARIRYAWLVGLLAGLAGLPDVCPVCDGVGRVGVGEGELCKCCLGDGQFRFDLVCWNYSRLHFVGGRKSAEIPMDTRVVVSGKGYGLDCEAWLEGSGWADFWLGCVAELDLEGAVRGAGSVSVGGSTGSGTGDEELHPDPEISAAIAACKITLLERVRRAALYVGSPEFPASVSGARGHDALMRAASAVVTGFLVPLVWAGEEWALRILELCFNPRCRSESGEPFPWSSREITKKLRDVRLIGNKPGSLLERPSNEGALFYVVGSDGSQGQPADMAGVYSSRGDQLSSTTRSGALLSLSVDAARACPVRPFDPFKLPDTFRPRQTSLDMPVRSVVASAVVAAGAGANSRVDPLLAYSLAPVASSANSANNGSLTSSLPGNHYSDGLDDGNGPRLRVVKGDYAGGLDEGGYKRRSKSKIPSDADWDVVVIDSDDEAAKRLIVEQMNARYALIKQTRDSIIVDLEKVKHLEEYNIPHLSISGFEVDQAIYPLRFRTLSKNGVEKLTEASRARLWLNSPYRRQYARWAFEPEVPLEASEALDRTTKTRRLYNLFNGWAVKPSNEGLGLIPKFVRLVNEIIAGGDEAYARYIWVWFADIFQNPADKPGIALYLYSKGTGTGKGSLFDVMGALLGRHYVEVSSAESIVGQWSQHLQDKLLVFFDEANSITGPQADKLNSLITEANFTSEQKFLPLQSCRAYMRFAFASNRTDGITIRPEDRRFAAFTVKPDVKQDAEFFGELFRELASPCEALKKSVKLDPRLAMAGAYRGYSALLGHLLNGVRTRGGEPIPGRPELGGGVDLRKIPRTELRVSMMIEELRGLEAFLFTAACRDHRLGEVKREAPNGRMEPYYIHWPKMEPLQVSRKDFVTCYKEWCRQTRAKFINNLQWSHLEEVFTLGGGSGGSAGGSGSGGRGGKAAKPVPDADVIKAEGFERVYGVADTVYQLPSGLVVDEWIRGKYRW